MVMMANGKSNTKRATLTTCKSKFVPVATRSLHGEKPGRNAGKKSKLAVHDAPINARRIIKRSKKIGKMRITCCLIS